MFRFLRNHGVVIGGLLCLATVGVVLVISMNEEDGSAPSSDESPLHVNAERPEDPNQELVECLERQGVEFDVVEGEDPGSAALVFPEGNSDSDVVRQCQASIWDDGEAEGMNDDFDMDSYIAYFEQCLPLRGHDLEYVEDAQGHYLDVPGDYQDIEGLHAAIAECDSEYTRR